MSGQGRLPGFPVRLVVGALLAMVMLAAMAPPGSAQVRGAMVAGEGTDEVGRIIGDIVVAVVRLLLGVGGAVFVVGVARGAFDGVLGSVFGVPGAVSVGLTRAAGVAAAFLLLLVSFGLSRAFVDLMVDQFVSRGALTAPVPDQVEVYIPQGGHGLQGLAGVIGEVLRIVLFLVGAWFLAGMLLALINGEIALATGSPGGLARLVERAVTSLVVLAIGVATPSLTRELARAIEGAGVITSGGEAIHLYGVVFAVIIDILLAAFVGVLIIVTVGSGFAAQAGMALGLPGGLGTALAQVVTAFAIGLVGFGVIALANQLILSLLS